MHTPEQARSLWCPMVRIARRETERPRERDSSLGAGKIFIVGGCNSDALGGNRVPVSCRCIADQCAMWRWAPNKVTVQKLGAATALTSHGPEKTHGYCGLAGRQEA